MENQYECIKIKDGLYIGNSMIAQDYEFLTVNKFGYVINCAAETPNYFDNHGIRYLKFKLIRNKQHKLFDPQLKKLKKIEKFIENCQQNSICCLISSNYGNNRSLAILTAYLMYKYKWQLAKTLQYIRSKSIFIGLSEHYISQLQVLEEQLKEIYTHLSCHWNQPYINYEEQIICKTYLNSKEICLENIDNAFREKKSKRVVWKDKLTAQNKSTERKTKLQMNDSEEKIRMKKSKVNKNELSKEMQKQKSNNSISMSKLDGKSKGRKNEEMDNNQAKHYNCFNQSEFMKLIKSNLGMRKKVVEGKDVKDNDGKENQSQDKDIYKLTINNYIHPNINIVNTLWNEGKSGKECSAESKNRNRSHKQNKNNKEPKTCNETNNNKNQNNVSNQAEQIEQQKFLQKDPVQKETVRNSSNSIVNIKSQIKPKMKKNRTKHQKQISTKIPLNKIHK